MYDVGYCNNIWFIWYGLGVCLMGNWCLYRDVRILDIILLSFRVVTAEVVYCVSGYEGGGLYVVYMVYEMPYSVDMVCGLWVMRCGWIVYLCGR